MFIVQNQSSPGAVLSGLLDIMRRGVTSVRICSAYISLSGSQMLFEWIARSSTDGDPATVEKTIVTSLDFGLTEPGALRFWRDMDNSRVLVAGAPHLGAGRLTTHAAFHPKLYIFDRQDGTAGSLVGSANLTSRGLTVNAEVGWLEMAHHAPEPLNHAWNEAIDTAVDLTPAILDQYSGLRQRIPIELQGEEMASAPALQVREQGDYPLMTDAPINPGDFEQMWVQALLLSGGSGSQLELPRGSHRFFGATYQAYDDRHVTDIVKPTLVSGTREWPNRPVRWHGDNQMERFNLPTLLQGGYSYEHSLILFRRIEQNTFELRVHLWDSDVARSFVEASRLQELLFLAGRGSPRFAGLLA